jgi:hypothetical protein
MAWKAPIVVHPLYPGDGRKVTVRGHSVGFAHSDRELVALLRRVGLSEVDMALDDPHLVEWRGGRPHVWRPDEATAP